MHFNFIAYLYEGHVAYRTRSLSLQTSEHLCSRLRVALRTFWSFSLLTPYAQVSAQRHDESVQQ